MSEHWNFYFCEIGGEPATVFVDLARIEGAPDPRRPQCVRVGFDFLTRGADGFPERDESVAVEPLEDAIVEAVVEALDAVFVARTTGGGSRLLYFYAGSHVGLERALERFAAEWPEHPLEGAVHPDPDWSVYLERLYPSWQEMQRMENRAIATALEAEGDTGELPRPVDHWCWFADAADRAEVAAALEARGFTVVAAPDDENPVAPRRHGLHLRRVERVVWFEIDATTDAVIGLLDGRDARYVGWESPVVRTDGG